MACVNGCLFRSSRSAPLLWSPRWSAIRLAREPARAGSIGVAIGLKKEDLVQALGLSFTVSTIALGVNVAVAGGLNISMASATLAALALACGGMWVGQAVRLWLSPVAFGRWFFPGLLMLGLYLVARSVV